MCTYNHLPSPVTSPPAKKEIFRHILAVTNRQLCHRPLTEQVEQICQHHPKGIILREKDLNEAEYTDLAKNVLEICWQNKVPCILHTYIHAARALNCTRIHLPLPLLRAHARQLQHFNYFCEIGCSIHQLNEAKEAFLLGATYLTAGHIYSTDCKKGVPPRGLSFLREICQSVPLPVYAIGGIKLDEKQLQEIQNCGAAGGCVMSGIMEL